MEYAQTDSQTQQLLTTIDYFYNKAPMESRTAFKETEQKLLDFTKSDSAWEAWFAILKTEGPTIQQLFFAANTLKTKMLFDFDSLKTQHPDVADKFGEEILNLIKVHWVTCRASNVLDSLCLALAMYWVHKDYLFEIDSILNGNIYEVRCMFTILKMMSEEGNNDSIVV